MADLWLIELTWDSWSEGDSSGFIVSVLSELVQCSMDPGICLYVIIDAFTVSWNRKKLKIVLKFIQRYFFCFQLFGPLRSTVLYKSYVLTKT